MADDKPTGRCPVCTGDFRLRKNGTLWNHNGDYHDSAGFRLRCKGAGGAPKTPGPAPKRVAVPDPSSSEDRRSGDQPTTASAVNDVR